MGWLGTNLRSMVFVLQYRSRPTIDYKFKQFLLNARNFSQFLLNCAFDLIVTGGKPSLVCDPPIVIVNEAQRVSSVTRPSKELELKRIPRHSRFWLVGITADSSRGQ